MMDLLWDDRSGTPLPPEAEALLQEVLTLGLAYTKAPPAVEISLSWVTPEEIRQLNQAYRAIDAETDVLSFPFYETPFDANAVPSGQPLALGDIVICTAVAEAQARQYGHSFMRELAFLTVHGLLHLLGYDHETPEDEQHMQKTQEDILNQAGISR